MKFFRIPVVYLLLFSILFVNCHKGIRVAGKKALRPLNIILLIGDGMGLAQISAAAVMNGSLNLDLFKIIGLVRTSSSGDYITDSAAGATAYSGGVRTFNGAIGVGPDSAVLVSILELAEKNGLSTGLVSTCSITHATPGAFYAHRVSREMHRQIADDFYGKDIDYAAGSGKPFFSADRLKADGYSVHTGTADPDGSAGRKLVWFYGDSIDLPRAEGRGDWLTRAAMTGIDRLSSNKKGFFMMIEGSQIDWGGHDTDLSYTVSELIDFDRMLGRVLDFAAKDGNTLVLVTADHETGGLSLTGGDLAKKKVTGHYATDHHTGIMVPLYAFGPGAEKFSGTYDNTEVFTRMKELLGL